MSSLSLSFTPLFPFLCLIVLNFDDSFHLIFQPTNVVYNIMLSIFHQILTFTTKILLVPQTKYVFLLLLLWSPECVPVWQLTSCGVRSETFAGPPQVQRHCRGHSSGVPALLGAHTCCRCSSLLSCPGRFLRRLFFCLPMALYLCALPNAADPHAAANPWLTGGPRSASRGSTALGRVPSETAAPLQPGGPGWASGAQSLNHSLTHSLT